MTRTTKRRSKGSNRSREDLTLDDHDSALMVSYDRIPQLEITKLPRGGVSMDTDAVGRVQFGIPPETIKDSMRLGIEVPSIYIVPVERFCRDMGPALGANLAEFEFPAYFNFFVKKKRCTLIVDSIDAESNIRRVFSETLLGPARFRKDGNDGLTHEEEDFAPDFPRDAIPDFRKELKHFRIGLDGKELVLETLLKFHHFVPPSDDTSGHDRIGIPPPLSVKEAEEAHIQTQIAHDVPGQVVIDMANKIEKLDIDDKIDGVELAYGGGGRNKSTGETFAYAQVKLVGELALVHHKTATPDQICNGTCKRVEIFKIHGGTEYVIHDINEKNIIVGKARFSGHVRVSESMTVDGFGGRSIITNPSKRSESNPNKFDEEDYFDGMEDIKKVGGSLSGSPSIPRSVLPPTFHAPSFGVTVLGNSHGFDKNGSVSGYVLWINGRGVMIDPPPYSSKTLELEGIRPRTIVGIILTHCHADHDAGAFQKVLAGSRVVVITTPTIYKSFIRKYAALSNLSPALLRHCHRHKLAVIGAPMRFQGATFHFTYTLHSIPCVGFRVEWRGRSMVFTGDHFNSPEAIDKLQETGVLSQARAQDLLNLPLQDTDLLLHEAGIPPLHTPLEVLLKLPKRVKDRLYVVHTAALPDDCELRVAPTGTAGTIRLDERLNIEGEGRRRFNTSGMEVGRRFTTSSITECRSMGPNYSNKMEGLPFEDDTTFQSMWTSSEYDSFGGEMQNKTPIKNNGEKGYRSSTLLLENVGPPLVALRPTSSTDAWFILNLLSAVPFLSSLSYSSTMEVLDTARVDAFCINDVVVPAARRKEVLCVVWEGTCIEREKVGCSGKLPIRRDSHEKRVSIFEVNQGAHFPLTAKEAAKRNYNRLEAVWHAGDWTGPSSLQPEKRLSGESSLSATHDIVAMSQEGVKVITVDFANLHSSLRRGSSVYRKYLSRKAKKTNPDTMPSCLEGKPNGSQFADIVRNLNVIEILECNSTLRKITAVQKRHIESYAEGPVYYLPGERLWRAGATVDKAFIIVAGTVSFVPKRRNAGSSAQVKTVIGDEVLMNPSSLGEIMRQDAAKVIAELGVDDETFSGNSSVSSNTSDNKESHVEFGHHHATNNINDNNYYAKLSRGLQRRADSISAIVHNYGDRRDSWSTESHGANFCHDYCDSDGDGYGTHGVAQEGESGKTIEMMRRRSAKDRANKVLGSLYSRRAFTAGLVFSKGHFLGDVSKMIAGSLSAANDEDTFLNGDDSSVRYGFGEKLEGETITSDAPVGEMVIHEQEGAQHIVHSSTLAAGKDGCVLLVLLNTNLIPFLESNPGLLLSLLGTQVVL